MSRIQRKTSTYPDVIEAAKRDFELHGMGYRILSKKYGVPRSTIAFLATSRKWVKPSPPPAGSPEGYTAARDVETAVLADGLSHHSRATPLAAGAPTGLLVTRLRGWPRKHPRPEQSPTESIGPAAGSLDKWRTPAVSPDAPSTGVVQLALPNGPLLPPLPEDQRRISRKKMKVTESATIFPFPGPATPPPEQPGVTAASPDNSREEKARLRVALAAIRATMSLEQVELLERHEALLDRYSHLLEVYLDPERFLELTGLNENEKAGKIVSTRRGALGVLLPNDGDTLTGVIKTLTYALQQIVTLKRKVVGLDKIMMTTGGSHSSDPLADDDGEWPLVHLASLTTGQLRHVREAMELLQRHEQTSRETPNPPPPDPIEELRHPDFPLELAEPDIAESPPR